MLFVIICTMCFIKSGAGEDVIRKAVKGAVSEMVREEIKKQLPSLPKNYNPKDFILNIDPNKLR